MSAISIGGELVHYEVLGRGRPVILIHSWVGSWRYWVPTMQNLQLKYRVYALDLHGFGDSSKNPSKYTLDNQRKLLSDFMQAMGIPKAAIIGHGLGAWVAAEYARVFPEQAPRVMLISAPLFDMPNLESRTRPGRGNAPVHTRTGYADVHPEATIMNSTIRTAMLERLRAATASGQVTADYLPEIPPAENTRYNQLQDVIGSSSPEALLQRCVKRSEPVYAKLETDLPKTDPQALRVSAIEYDCGRFLDTLWQLPMPTVVLHGEEDGLIEPPSEAVWNYITYDKEDKLLPIPLPNVRHFPMLEYDRFNRLINEFLEIPDISKLEVTERWKRRSR
ncbi:MAG: alpha/beta hydrolase [Chloroflexi bacterium]|nr:alpha/beta hydrolase [Chloroflexota bacterium]MCC6896528.1 alpha/beta hydrolase [Anaerolineae bacterium]